MSHHETFKEYIILARHTLVHLISHQVPGRTMWMHVSFSRCKRLKFCHLLQPIANSSLVCVICRIAYQTRFCLQMSYPAILFTMLMGLSNYRSFIVHALLPRTSKAFALSTFLPGACVHVLLPGTQRSDTYLCVGWERWARGRGWSQSLRAGSGWTGDQSTHWL